MQALPALLVSVFGFAPSPEQPMRDSKQGRPDE
jgi:hypothetical protein